MNDKDSVRKKSAVVLTYSKPWRRVYEICPKTFFLQGITNFLGPCNKLQTQCHVKLEKGSKTLIQLQHEINIMFIYSDMEGGTGENETGRLLLRQKPRHVAVKQTVNNADRANTHYGLTQRVLIHTHTRIPVPFN